MNRPTTPPAPTGSMTTPQLLPKWRRLERALPLVVTTMRRYLEQIACVLRPGSVSGTASRARQTSSHTA